MSAVLAREVFSTSRLAEFCSRQQLVTATGHAVEYWPLYVLKELVDNALDNCEEHGIALVVAIEVATNRITVADNGSGLPVEVLDRILDYGSRTSSREAYISPTRGAQGNAAQTVLALPFALDSKIGRVTVEAHGQAHEIEFRIDEIHQVPEITRSTSPSFVKDGTRITVWWPELSSSILADAKPRFLQIADHFTTLNPHLTIRLTVDGELEALTEASDPQWVKWRPSDPTSPHWYDAERLRRLIAAYVANGRGERPIREFIAEFAGLSGSAKQKAVLDATGLARASLANLCPDGRFDDRLVTRLLAAMQDQAKLIKPDTLGIIGRGHWQCSAEEYGGDLDTFVYRKFAGISDGLPWIVEAAFCLLTEADERVITRGVKFTPTLRDPFQQLSDGYFTRSLDSLLSGRSAGNAEPIAIFVHLTCLRIAFTDRGKAGVLVPREASAAIVEAVKAVVAKWDKQRKAEDRRAARKLNRKSALTVRPKADMNIKKAAQQVMAAAYDKASGAGRYPAKARQIMYAARPDILAMTGKDGFNDAYFTQILVPNYVEEHPGETANWDVVWDARGHFIEPHTGLSVPLGTLDVRQYLGERPRPVGLNISSSDFFPTSGPEHRFKNVLFIEKEGFDSLIASARIAERFDLAVMSTKGMSVTASRRLLDQLTTRGVETVFVLHDFDISGFGICGTLGTDSRRYRFQNIIRLIDLGLRLDDVNEMVLESEPVTIAGKWNKRQLTLQRHGATADEIEFLRSRRVELNAMTSPQFIALIETKLAGHSVTKLIPDSRIIETHWRRILADRSARQAFKEIRQKCEAEAAAAIPPPDLAQRVVEALQLNPRLPWDLALAFNDFD